MTETKKSLQTKHDLDDDDFEGLEATVQGLIMEFGTDAIGDVTKYFIDTVAEWHSE